MPVFFSLEAAKQEMGIVATVQASLETAGQAYQTTHPERSLRVIDHEPETIWHKLDHLLYLPILGQTRPSDLYYYQGAGLNVLYGFTYKYLPLEQFLGQLTRLQIGNPLADRLAKVYSQAWYPGDEPLFIFTDWHSKPHWTKADHLSGHITMWGRIMPGTHQLLINGPQGHLLGGWNYPIDARLPHVLIDLEADLANKLERSIAYNIFDSEGGGLPLALRYEQAKRDYISLLPRQDNRRLADFELQGEWQSVENDPHHEAVNAAWRDPQLRQADPRRLVLMRRLQDTDPTRVYAGRIPATIPAASVPARFRQRWACQERRIRELIHGANLNANFGYTYRLTPNRTQLRRWQDTQDKVEACERRLAEHTEALTNLHCQQATLQQSSKTQQTELQQQIAAQKTVLHQLQEQGQRFRRCEQGQQRLERSLARVQARQQRQANRLQKIIEQHQAQHQQLQQELAERQAARDAIDTESLCRQRNLEKDQIMLDLQVLLVSLHDWCKQHYFPPEWQQLELDTATQLIYRKSGQVFWGQDEIKVTLDPYRYSEHQRAIEATCRRFNAARMRWRDGRLLTIQVAQDPNFQLCDCQGAGQT